MEESIKKLARLKQEVQDLKDEVEYTRGLLATSFLGRLLEEKTKLLTDAKNRLRETEAFVRDMALAQFAATGERHPHAAVTVVNLTVLTYRPEDALEYCRQHLPNALKLNVRAFEKVAKVADLDFVTIETEPSTRISKDLSEYV